jgi:hypothetical protein
MVIKTRTWVHLKWMAISHRLSFSRCSGYPLQVRHSPNEQLPHRALRSYPAALQRWNAVGL